jgi:hypothetical protein
MTRTLFAAAVALMLCVPAAQSQESASTTRLEAQHKPTATMEKHLAQYEENLLKTLASENPAVQAQAVQTFRELEQMFPKYPFSSSLAPLSAKLKDENTDSVVRRLAALALDELHSDAGDAVVKEVGNSSKDKGLQSLCNALQVRSQIK